MWFSKENLPDIALVKVAELCLLLQDTIFPKIQTNYTSWHPVRSEKT